MKDCKYYNAYVDLIKDRPIGTRYVYETQAVSAGNCKYSVIEKCELRKYKIIKDLLQPKKLKEYYTYGQIIEPPVIVVSSPPLASNPHIGTFYFGKMYFGNVGKK